MIRLKSLIPERYGGSSKEIGIWYHGTSSKRIPMIMSRGLDPNIPIKNKSWDSDSYVNVINLDKTSYGGIYVTQNLMSAISAATRTSRKDNTTSAIIIMSLQSRSLIGDEDDFASRLMRLRGQADIFQAIYPYMWETYGAPEYHKEWAEKLKNDWCDNVLESLFYEFKIDDPRFQDIVRNLLYSEGYKAMLTRTVSYLKKSESHSEYWEWRKAYADVHKFKDYGDDVDIPNPPPSTVGENMFRAFIDKLTKTMKHKARHTFTGSFSKTARSLEPIKFHGTNKIISIVEIIPSPTVKYQENVKLKYGTLPDDFKTQWIDRVGTLHVIN